MRQLTAQQKRLLDIVSKERANIGLETLDVNDLPDGIFEKLEKMNDTEILWQEVNRYLWDKNSINHQFKI